MARVAVILDRSPQDPEWKGAFAWDIVLALAESQHEVLALTPLDPASIEVAHPRLTVVRPAPGFELLHFAKWLRALLQFRPEILHTFALSPPRALNIWPLVEPALKAMPHIRRYSTALGEEDFTPFETVRPPLEFSPVQSARAVTPAEGTASGDLIVPAPVDAWERPQVGLLMLADFLMNSPAVNAFIIGGWGGCTLSERREGWSHLSEVAARVHMLEPLNWRQFVQRLTSAKGLWLKALKANSWTALASAHVAAPLGLPVWGESPHLHSGSSANFLSRLYSQR